MNMELTRSICKASTCCLFFDAAIKEGKLSLRGCATQVLTLTLLEYDVNFILRSHK